MSEKVGLQPRLHSFSPSSAPAPEQSNLKHRNEQNNTANHDTTIPIKRKLPLTEAHNQARLCKKNKTNPKNKRGPGYSPLETRSLLNLLEEFLPITPREWDELTMRHGKAFSDCFRTVRSIRRKFYTLQRAPLSSDPHSFSSRARRISAWIKDRAQKKNTRDEGDSSTVVSTKAFDRVDPNQSYRSDSGSEEDEDDDLEYYESGLSSEEEDDDDDEVLTNFLLMSAISGIF